MDKKQEKYNQAVRLMHKISDDASMSYNKEFKNADPSCKKFHRRTSYVSLINALTLTLESGLLHMLTGYIRPFIPVIEDCPKNSNDATIIEKDYYLSELIKLQEVEGILRDIGFDRYNDAVTVIIKAISCHSDFNILNDFNGYLFPYWSIIQEQAMRKQLQETMQDVMDGRRGAKIIALDDEESNDKSDSEGSGFFGGVKTEA